MLLISFLLGILSKWMSNWRNTAKETAKLADQYKYMGNCPPTPPLHQH